MLLTRAQILAVHDLQSEDVPVPEWGGTVRVRGLTAAERLEVTRQITTPDGEVDRGLTLALQIRIPFLCMIGDDGQRLFVDEADVTALGQKSPAALDRVLAVAQRLSGLSEAALEQQKKA